MACFKKTKPLSMKKNIEVIQKAEQRPVKKYGICQSRWFHLATFAMMQVTAVVLWKESLTLPSIALSTRDSQHAH